MDNDINPNPSSADFIIANQRGAIGQAITGLDADPEAAARSMELSSATGVPAPIIHSNLENFEKQHKASLTTQLLNNNQYLQTFINSNPMAAKIANDDYANLDAVSQRVSGMTLPMQMLRAPERLADTMFPGDPLKRFKEGGPLGSWLRTEDLKNYPVASAIAAGLGTPVELFLRGAGGVIETAADAAANVGGREAGALVEAEAMGLTGRHPIHETYERVRPYIENGREPPPTVLPEYDQYRAKQNADDLAALKEATTDAQSSLTRERSPDLFRDFIAQHTDHEIGIGGDAAVALYGDKLPSADDNLLGWVPDIESKLAIARATGDDVRVPLADWLTHAEPDVMKALHDDIRVREGGITANEVKLGKEVEPEGPKAEPIAEPVPTTRAAAALEPMLSIGDRNLKIERLKGAEGAMFGPEHGFHDFSINDEKGNPVGTINLSQQREGKDLYVEMINGVNGLGPRDFGPSLMKSLKAQLKQEFPEAERLGGHRVGGMREKFGTYNLPSAQVWVKLDRLGDDANFRQILEDGQWETFSPNIQAYIKPDAMRSAQDRQLVDIVTQELDRIAPKKTAIQAADTIKADTNGLEGQRSGEDIKVGGTYIRYRDTYPIILYALDSENALGAARHEAIHHLRSYGFFGKEEWATLEAEALAGGWLKKYNIDGRYPTAKPDLKLEEAIAEAYMDWSKQKDTLADRARQLIGIESPINAIFRKMKAFFDGIKDRVAQLLGKDASWEDVFKKVDTGEVGGREGTEPLDARAFNEKLAIPEDLTGMDQPPNLQEPFIPMPYRPRSSSSARIDAELGWQANDKTLTAVAKPGEEFKGKYAIRTRAPEDYRAVYQEGKNFWVSGRNKSGPITKEAGPFDSKELAYKWIADQRPAPGLEPKLSVEDGGSRDHERAQTMGMPVTHFRQYDKLMQARHAEDIAAATKRATEEQAREHTKQWKEDRKALRQEVSENIKQRPDVAADLFFGAGELYGKKVPLASVKMDASALTAEQKAGLPRAYYGEKGIHPDEAASIFGYGSGDAMVAKLIEYNANKLASGMSAKDFVSRVTDIETDRQMRIKHGVLEDNIMDAVKEQVAGETQQDIVHEETLFYATKAGQVPATRENILGAVREMFKGMPLSAVNSDRLMAKIGSLGRQVEAFHRTEDWASAFKVAQQREYAITTAAEMIKVEKELTRFDKLAKRFSKREVPTVAQDYTNFIHDILMRSGKPVRRSVQDLETEIAAGEYDSLEKFVEGKQSFYLREVAVADMLLDPSFRKKFEDLTVDQFDAVNTSIKSLVANGRDEMKITKAGVAEDLVIVKNQMIDQLKQFQERQYDAKGGRWMGPIPPRVAKVLRSYGVAHIQMENLFNRWDHDNPQGVFQQYIMRDLVDASNNESVMEKRYAEKLRGLDDKADLKKLVDNTLFKVPNSDQLMQLNRGNLRTILLNAGNESNLSKLAGGYKLKPEQVMGWLRQHATEEDWQWAQKMGDVFADLKAEADLMYRNLSGVAPENIPLKPIDRGNMPPMKGWYYPIIWHPEFEGSSRKLMGKDALEQAGFVRATTSNGYTQKRTGYAAPMALDLDMLPARMKQMVHDVAMRPSVINASKIFYDADIKAAVSKHFGNEWRDMMIPYLIDVANSANYIPKDQRMFYNASEFLRQNMITTLVGLNPGTVLKHGPTAFVQSVHEVGAVNLLKAFKGLFSINERTGESNWQFAMKESEELQRRHQNYVETLGGATEMMMPSNGFMSLRSTVQRFSAMPVAFSDLLSAVPTWLAKYETSMAENGGIHGDAVYDANRAVRRAHGSVAITNRSTVMRGGALGQWFASVYGFFNHIMNRQYEMLWKAGEMVGDAKAGNYKEAMARAPELTSMLFAYVLAPALIEEMVTPLMSSENESWGKKAAKGLAFTLGASWVGVRDIASAILNGRDPSVGLISTAGKTITDVARDLNKQAPFNKEHAGKVIKDGATMLGGLTGVVPAQTGRVAEFGLGVHQGTERPKGPWGWLTGARYGTLKGHPATFNEWQKHHLGGH